MLIIYVNLAPELPADCTVPSTFLFFWGQILKKENKHMGSTGIWVLLNRFNMFIASTCAIRDTSTGAK